MIVFISNMWLVSIFMLFMSHYIYWNINSYHYMYNYSYTFKPLFILITILCLMLYVYLTFKNHYNINDLILTKKIIDKMKILEKSNLLYKSHICVICNDTHDYNELIVSKCGHVYSKECLMIGINKMNAVCALCRKKIE